VTGAAFRERDEAIVSAVLASARRGFTAAGQHGAAWVRARLGAGRGLGNIGSNAGFIVVVVLVLTAIVGIAVPQVKNWALNEISDMTSGF
jgi:hypothetical protein